MKRMSILHEELKLLSHFSKDSVYQLGTKLGLSGASIDTYISRFLKRKQLITLKKGLYISTDFLEKHSHDVSYKFNIANILRKPSYVSSWSALQYYDLTTEAIRTITSVTPKLTRTWQTKVGTFSYQSIRSDLFTGFELEKQTFDFFIASPSKALFDLLYFRTHRFPGMTKKDVVLLTEELRIDIDELESAEKEKFYSMISHFCHE